MLNNRKHFHSKGFGNLDLETVFFTFCYVNRNKVQRHTKPLRLLNLRDHATPNGNMQSRHINWISAIFKRKILDSPWYAYLAEKSNFHASLTGRLLSLLCWQNISSTLILFFCITRVSTVVIEQQLIEEIYFCARCLL